MFCWLIIYCGGGVVVFFAFNPPLVVFKSLYCFHPSVQYEHRIWPRLYYYSIKQWFSNWGTCTNRPAPCIVPQLSCSLSAKRHWNVHLKNHFHLLKCLFSKNVNQFKTAHWVLGAGMRLKTIEVVPVLSNVRWIISSWYNVEAWKLNFKSNEDKSKNKWPGK